MNLQEKKTQVRTPRTSIISDILLGSKGGLQKGLLGGFVLFVGRSPSLKKESKSVRLVRLP